MAQQVDEKVSTLNPFPGLRPFKIEESHLFFGREGQSDEVLLKLSKSRFVGVIGPSGSGKSSFIYCGVLPILYGGFLTDASPKLGSCGNTRPVQARLITSQNRC
jgi:ABC-type transport system involved in cytochrome bd biosynthesis fused ATPase/permease subunit